MRTGSFSVFCSRTEAVLSVSWPHPRIRRNRKHKATGPNADKVLKPESKEKIPDEPQWTKRYISCIYFHPGYERIWAAARKASKAGAAQDLGERNIPNVMLIIAIIDPVKENHSQEKQRTKKAGPIGGRKIYTSPDTLHLLVFCALKSGLDYLTPAGSKGQYTQW
jgi:hypothetical protein